MPSGVYLRTKEHKRKLSEAGSGEKHHMFGKKLSRETKKKISESLKQNPIRYWLNKKRPPFSEKIKKKMGEAHKGKKHSEETKRKMSLAKKGKYMREKNSRWQGGKSFEPYSFDWTDILRESIRKRDNYVCQMCGIHQNELEGRFKKLDCHHIDYDKNNLDPKNLISLCKNCHMQTNNNRDYWINYFKNSLD